MRRASIAGIKLTGYAGSLANIANVIGHGLQGLRPLALLHLLKGLPPFLHLIRRNNLELRK